MWLIFIELVVVNFAWTFDITYSFRILQVIWAIGISMLVLSALVYLPEKIILIVGVLIVFGHNLLDGITVTGDAFKDLLWYTLHQPKFLILGSGNILDFVYPVLPWIGLMALGYVCGSLYRPEVDPLRRKRFLLRAGISVIVLFFILRYFNLYGEMNHWQGSFISFLNTTKYPPSLHFLLMTMGPALIFLAFSETIQNKIMYPILTLGKVPFFFYILHLYVIHLLATMYMVYEGETWNAYVISAKEILSGRLSRFGLSLEAVYLIWIMVVAALYPLCKWYQGYKQAHFENKWLRYL